MNETTQKPTVQSYTTAQLCEIVGLTPPRVHQLRNGQIIKVKKANKEYTYPPTLIENVHWMWKDTEVLFFPNSIELLLSIKNNKKSQIKTLEDAPAKTKKTNAKPSVDAQVINQSVEEIRQKAQEANDEDTNSNSIAQ